MGGLEPNIEDAMKYIGKDIKSRMDLSGLAVKDMTYPLHPVMNIALSTAKDYVSSVRRGDFIYSYDRDRSRQNKLRWLSILMYSLGINETDEIVSRTRNTFPRFKFPPSQDDQVILNAKPRRYAPYDGYTISEKIEKLKPRHRKRLESTVNTLLKSYEKQNN